MNKKIIIGVIVIISILGIVLWAGGTAIIKYYPRVYKKILESSSYKVGAIAPDFELSTVSGERLKLSQFRGQSVILTIGATWCPDCKREAPLLQKLHEDHPEIAIIMVDSKEEKSVVNEFVDTYAKTNYLATFLFV